ncbi:MAG: efflux RND transporter permease subunit [Bdellovibrionales bacterium]|nr:efflux RND transporter permease subunit [Bdellovibrionales bacterium]
MTLSDISIRRPVFAWMLMVGMLVFGAIGFSRMGISQLPDVDFPVVNVSVTWTGASPGTIETAVTDVIEDAVMSVEGVQSVSSRCQEGISNTSIEFDLNRNIDVALQEVQTKVAQAQKRLPDDVDPAVVTKSNPEDQPIIWAALSGGKDLREKILFARDRLKDQLTTIAGVGDVRLGGYVDPNMRVWLSTDKMQARQISVEDVKNALTAGSTIVPTGYLDSGEQETNLRVISEASTPEDFRKVVIPTRGGAPIWSQIRLGDVARIEDGLADIRRISRINGKSAVGFGVIKQRGSNAVAVGRAVKERIRFLKSGLKDMDLTPVNDSTRFIEESTHELLFTLALSAILTSIVCYLFLGTVSAAFNVVLAIPVSLIGSFIVLYFCGFTINTFTLLALSLSIGIVVDDAIMVLENIVRHFEQGMGKVKASLVGAREITGAATASSIAILAIFLPVIFMKGIVGKFFFQFGVAMSVAVIFSLLEALTLAPMRCSQFLSSAKAHGNKLTRAVDSFMNRLVTFYRKVLERALENRWKVIGAAVACFILSLFLVTFVRQEFVPAQDQSRLMLNVYTKMGSSLEFTDSVFKKIEAIIMKRPEVENIYVAVGGTQGGLVNQGIIFVMLKPKGDRGVNPPFTREPNQQDFMGFLRKELSVVKEAQKIAISDPSQGGFAGRGKSYPIQFQVQGPDWSVLSEKSIQIMEKMKESGFATDVDSDYNPDMPETQILPDRAKAEARGVTISNIANTISAMVGSLQVGKYTDESGHRNDVRVKLEDRLNKYAKDVTRIWIRNSHGEMLPLSDVVSVKEGSSLLTISRYNRERSITITGNLVKGKSQAAATETIQKIASETLSDGYHIVLTGNSQAFQESFQSLIVALILGILVAYMVLASQFNSFVHPATVLLALPFSVIGAFAALLVFDISLNIYSMIGILLLMGIVKKNSILLVEFTNHHRHEGAGVKESLLEACPMRLRPILMTSIATVTAAIPAALAIGPGAETTRAMAAVVIGGVITSTLLTLVVVPCAYSLFSALERPQHGQELKQALTELGER